MIHRADQPPTEHRPGSFSTLHPSKLLAAHDARVGGKLVVDVDGFIHEANDRAATLMVQSEHPGEMIGRSILDLFGKVFAEDRLRLIRMCVELGEALYFCAMVRGAWSHILYEPLDDVGNGKPGISSTSHRVMAGLSTLPQMVRVRLVQTTVHDLGPLAGLTRRELQVLKMIGDGHSAASIAEKLFRSKRTIQWHRASLGKKLGVTNRVKLAQIAYAAGLPEFDVDQVYDLLHNRKRTKKAPAPVAAVSAESGA